MNIRIVTPAPPRSRTGNRITALRWARIIRELGHRVDVAQRYQERPRGRQGSALPSRPPSTRRCDLLIALHARRSFDSINRFARDHPRRPVVVALTGTDLYGDTCTHPKVKRSIGIATRLIVLQAMAVDELPKHLRANARVIYQSVARPLRTIPHRTGVFEVCVLGHLREVKDPFRTAMAARLLSSTSRLEVTHIGASLSDRMADRARRETAANPRYRWLGELPWWRAMRVLRRSRLLVISSRMEGGANVVSEAIAASVPVLSSRVAGSMGILGQDYPGYFPVGDTEALASLLARAERDANFHRSLRSRCRGLAPLVDPKRERRSWAGLLRGLFPRA